MASKVDDPNEARQGRWAQYQKYLDGLEKHLSADSELKPGSHAFVKLRELSDRLTDLQERDFVAKQLKQEIDRALAAAAGGGGLVQAFAALAKGREDDSFE